MAATEPELSLPLTWEVNMGQARPERRWVCLAAALAMAAIALVFWANPFLAVLGFVVVIASTGEMFFPIRYRLDERKAQAKIALSTTELLWDDVRRMIPVEGGVRLSPLERASWLDNYRGVYLRFSGNEQAVLATIRALWKADERRLDGADDSRGGGGDD